MDGGVWLCVGGFGFGQVCLVTGRLLEGGKVCLWMGLVLGR